MVWRENEQGVEEVQNTKYVQTSFQAKYHLPTMASWLDKSNMTLLSTLSQLNCHSNAKLAS